MTKELVSLNSPSEIQEFAVTLKEFIVSQNLYTNIKGRNYVNVEGWQFAGISTGVLPVIKSVESIATMSGDKEIKYRAEVELKQGENVVGYGVAICSNKERMRADADEYVIASMAQTRAIGKAYRNVFAFLMKMAGYEATPAEEMDGVHKDTNNDKNPHTAQPVASQGATEKQIKAIENRYFPLNWSDLHLEKKFGKEKESLTKKEADKIIKWMDNEIKKIEESENE